MYILIVVLFVLGYAAIAFEHPLKINKTAIALLTGVLCWVIYIMGSPDKEHVSDQLYHHIGQVSGILFFLLGAMTIVEIVDAHNGFAVITDRIKTKNTLKLLWIVSIVTFFL